MDPVKIFKIIWNIWAVIGMLLTFAVLGVQIGEFATWALDGLQGLLNMSGA